MERLRCHYAVTDQGEPPFALATLLPTIQDGRLEVQQEYSAANEQKLVADVNSLKPDGKPRIDGHLAQEELAAEDQVLQPFASLHVTAKGVTPDNPTQSTQFCPVISSHLHVCLI